MTSPAIPQAWSHARRFAFRWSFIFFALQVLQWAEFYGVLIFEKVQVRLADNYLVNAPSDWICQHMLNLCPSTGPGAPHIVWIMRFVFLAVVSLIGAVVWTVVDRRRLNYVRLQDLLRVCVRYVLGYVMWHYAVIKINGGQFSHGYTGTNLWEQIGYQQPTALMWQGMGTSHIYALFSAIGETSGLLLFFRRTTLIGAMMVTVVAATIWVLDVAHNPGTVTGTIFSLMLMAIFLIVTDWKRFSRFYVRNSAVPADPGTPKYLTATGWGLPKPLAIVLRLAFLTVFLWKPTSRLKEGIPFYLSPGPSGLNGTFRLETAERKGVKVPLRWDDSTTWEYVELLGSYGRRWDSTPEMLTALTPDGGKQFAKVETDTAKRIFTVKELPREGTPKTLAVLTYQLADSSRLILSGAFGSDTMTLFYKRVTDDESTLRSKDSPLHLTWYKGDWLARFRKQLARGS
jgi:hypothetical protein